MLHADFARKNENIKIMCVCFDFRARMRFYSKYYIYNYRGSSARAF